MEGELIQTNELTLETDIGKNLLRDLIDAIEDLQQPDLMLSILEANAVASMMMAQFFKIQFRKAKSVEPEVKAEWDKMIEFVDAAYHLSKTLLQCPDEVDDLISKMVN